MPSSARKRGPRFGADGCPAARPSASAARRGADPAAGAAKRRQRVVAKRCGARSSRPRMAHCARCRPVHNGVVGDGEFAQIGQRGPAAPRAGTVKDGRLARVGGVAGRMRVRLGRVAAPGTTVC